MNKSKHRPQGGVLTYSVNVLQLKPVITQHNRQSYGGGCMKQTATQQQTIPVLPTHVRTVVEGVVNNRIAVLREIAQTENESLQLLAVIHLSLIGTPLAIAEILEIIEQSDNLELQCALAEGFLIFCLSAKEYLPRLIESLPQKNVHFIKTCEEVIEELSVFHQKNSTLFETIITELEWHTDDSGD